MASKCYDMWILRAQAIIFPPSNHLPLRMPPPISLVTLRNGLHRLKEASRKRKEDLEAHLSRSEKISSEDENWLDTEANHIDKQALVDTLKEAPDYEAALKVLTPAQNGLVKKLGELAYEGARSETTQTGGSGKKVSGTEPPAISKKRKSEFSHLTSRAHLNLAQFCRAP